MVFEGPPPAFDDFADHVRGRLHLVPRYRQKLACPAAGDRPAAVGRRPDLQPRVPPAPHRAARAGQRGPAARARGAHPLAAARPRQAAVGVVARAGARGRPLGADLQDPPRGRGRHRGRRPGDRAVRPRAGAGADAARGRAVGAAVASRARPRWPRAASAGWSSCRSRSPAARCGRPRSPATSLHGAREAVEGVAEVGVGGPEPGARHAAQRADRPAPAAGPDPQRAGRVQAHQGRLRRHGQRRRADAWWPAACAAGCSRAACAPRGSSCGRSSRSRSAPPTSAATWATGSPSCAGRCRSTSRTRSRACRWSAQAMDGLKESKQAVGAEVLTECAEPGAADGARPGLADQLLHPPVQPARDERAGPAVPALRARPQARGPVPGRLPAARPRARGGDHVLRRRDGLRPARRLRRHAGPRRAGRDVRGGSRRAGRARRGAQSSNGRGH